jgi:hypothetical protein
MNNEAKADKIIDAGKSEGLELRWLRFGAYREGGERTSHTDGEEKPDRD